MDSSIVDKYGLIAVVDAARTFSSQDVSPHAILISS